MIAHGVDVSRNQNAIDWPAVPDMTEFAMVGVTHWPTGEIDWQAATNVNGAGNRGVLVGGYQRVNPFRNTPQREAALAVSRLSSLDLLGPGRLMPALDVEPVESGRDREREAGIDMVAWVRELFASWMAITSGLPVLWYSSGSYFASKYGGFDGIPPGVKLWVAHWSGAYSTPKNSQFDPDLAEQWAGHTAYRGADQHPALMHQYWNRGTVPGIQGPVDLDCLMPGVKLTDVMQ